MNNLTDDKGQGASKKKIKARKPRTSPDSSVTNLNYEEDSYIPIASTDSQWNGIEFTVPKNENIEHMNCLSDVENEIQVIELENDENYPLLLLFPELKSEALNFQNILRREVSTSDVTKMLVGKKPNLALLKPCKKLNNKRLGLASITESSDSEDSIKVKKSTAHTSRTYRSDSRDGDESTVEDPHQDFSLPK